MRKQYHFRNSDKGLLAWDVDRLILLSRDLPIKVIKLSNLDELNEDYWFQGQTVPTVNSMIAHFQLIQACDLNYPIILCKNGRVMDGMHRVAKAKLQGFDTIKGVQFEAEIEPDYINVDPQSLPY